MIVHANNITQTDDRQSACELFRSWSYDSNQNRSTAGLQSFDTGPFILSLKKITKKIHTKDHAATIFIPFMTDGNKRVYKINLQLKVKMG